MKKKALITGITGQDGSYLAEFLLKKGYVVHGIKRKSSTFNTSRIDHIYRDIHTNSNFLLHYGDLTDSNSIVNVLSKIKPDEVYNLGAQSHVGHSFEIPEYTSEVTGLGTLRVLEAMRFLKLNKTKFYQASTSELFGEKGKGVKSFNEKSPMIPKSPYGVSKLYSYWITKVYRQAYNLVLRHLPSNKPMLETFKKSFNAARKLYVGKRRNQRLKITNMKSNTRTAGNSFQDNLKKLSVLPPLDRDGVPIFDGSKTNHSNEVLSGGADQIAGREIKDEWKCES